MLQITHLLAEMAALSSNLGRYWPVWIGNLYTDVFKELSSLGRQTFGVKERNAGKYLDLLSSVKIQF